MCCVVFLQRPSTGYGFFPFYSPQTYAEPVICGHTHAHWDNYRVCSGYREREDYVDFKNCSQADPCSVCSSWGPDRWKVARRNTTRCHSKDRLRQASPSVCGTFPGPSQKAQPPPAFIIEDCIGDQDDEGDGEVYDLSGSPAGLPLCLTFAAVSQLVKPIVFGSQPAYSPLTEDVYKVSRSASDSRGRLSRTPHHQGRSAQRLLPSKGLIHCHRYRASLIPTCAFGYRCPLCCPDHERHGTCWCD